MKFNHIFAALMVLAFLCAFLLPLRITNVVRSNLAILFYPVARPAHLIGATFRTRASPPKTIDDGSPNPSQRRPDSDLLEENQSLRVQIANLTGRLALLEQLDKQLASVGDLRQLCERFAVVGGTGDVASRQMLHVTASSLNNVQPRMPVLFFGQGGGGIAGWVDRVSAGGSTVKLITGKAFRINVEFARFVKDPSSGQLVFEIVPTPPVQAEGDGNGAMWVRNLALDEAKRAKLQPGDWAVLKDDDWPDALQRYRLGRIALVEPWSRGAGFAEIKIEPPTDLMALREVLVMNKK